MRRPPPRLRRLDASKLKPGDLVLTSDHSAVSLAIRTFTRSDISHVMIYVESHSIIDANNEGVHARNIQRLFFPADCALYVLRPKRALTPMEVEAICRHARSVVGAQYATLEAIQSISPVRARAGRRQFCSRLAAQAYAYAGRSVAREPDFVSPGDLLRSPHFRRVPGATVDVDPREAEAWARHPDLTQLMRQTTNAVLDGVRAIAPGIQSFDDVDAFLIANPEHDQAVLEVYDASGYLDAWQAELAQNPWRYDLGLMAKVAARAPEDITAYCRDTVTSTEGTCDRYSLNLMGYEALVRAHGLLTFARLRDLYATLVGMDTQRRSVAEQWLSLSGRAGEAPQAGPPPEFGDAPPHSEAWFAAFERRNPRQAALTRQVLSFASDSNVCSICGDDPAMDLRLLEPGVPHAQRLTLRLCEDCRAIRASGGEHFEAMDAAPTNR